jgi:hypothetical protein
MALFQVFDEMVCAETMPRSRSQNPELAAVMDVLAGQFVLAELNVGYRRSSLRRSQQYQAATMIGRDEGAAGLRFQCAKLQGPRLDGKIILPHSAHFRDNSCRFRHPLTPFLIRLVPRRPHALHNNGGACRTSCNHVLRCSQADVWPGGYRWHLILLHYASRVC